MDFTTEFWTVAIGVFLISWLALITLYKWWYYAREWKRRHD